jgi:predicted SnoaL-like aldol condensation-catalyzing enzyme
MTVELLELRKRAAADFLRLVATGKTDEAFERFVAQGFIHHNPHFASDAGSLKAGMAENAKQFPGKALEVQRVIGEGDLVAVHSRVRHTPDERGFALAHIFRFEGDRIAELWDLAMEIPAGIKNAHGMF